MSCINDPFEPKRCASSYSSPYGSFQLDLSVISDLQRIGRATLCNARSWFELRHWGLMPSPGDDGGAQVGAPDGVAQVGAPDGAQVGALDGVPDGVPDGVRQAVHPKGDETMVYSPMLLSCCKWNALTVKGKAMRLHVYSSLSTGRRKKS